MSEETSECADEQAENEGRCLCSSEGQQGSFIHNTSISLVAQMHYLQCRFIYLFIFIQ